MAPNLSAQPAWWCRLEKGEGGMRPAQEARVRAEMEEYLLVNPVSTFLF